MTAKKTDTPPQTPDLPAALRKAGMLVTPQPDGALHVSSDSPQEPVTPERIASALKSAGCPVPDMRMVGYCSGSMIARIVVPTPETQQD